MDQVDHSGFNTNIFAAKSDHQQIPRHEMVSKTLSFSSFQPIKPPHAVAIVYKECLKNHAASLGGHALDGCGEFMPLSSDQTDPNSMKCAACSCHRNFHRQDTVDGRREPPLLPPPVIPTSVGFTPPHFSLLPRRFASSPSTSPSPSPSPPRNLNPPPPPPPSAAGTLQQYSPGPHMLMALSTGNGASPPPPEHVNKNRAKTEQSKPTHHHQTRRNQNPNPNPIPNANPNPNSYNNNSSAKRKRFRSKFSSEQKEKMRRFAEGLNWKMQRNDEKSVSAFCEEIGVSKGVLKVWMHNNKNTVGNTPRNSNNNNSNHSSSCNNAKDEDRQEDQQINDDGNDQLGLIDHHQYNQHLQHHHRVGNNGSSCSA